MKPPDSRPNFVFHKTPVDGKADVEAPGRSLTDDVELTIDDNYEPGCDPYNTTGQHVILKMKKYLE